MKKVPEFKLRIEVSNDGVGLVGFKHAPEYVGKRFKLGGTPEFIEPSQQVKCPSCGKEMTFYAQLDSINDDLMLADCGLIYVFVCYDCFETRSFFQSQ